MKDCNKPFGGTSFLFSDLIRKKILTIEIIDGKKNGIYKDTERTALWTCWYSNKISNEKIILIMESNVEIGLIFMIKVVKKPS